MPELTDDAIRANLTALAAPADWPTGPLAAFAATLCAAQQTLAPVTAPRRLVLFAADHGSTDESDIAPAIREMASGICATSVLAKTINADLVLVDVGSLCHPLAESPNYRCRKVRSGTRAHAAASRTDEFRAAFAVGRSEAEQAARDGMKVVSTDAIGRASVAAASAVGARLATLADPNADPLPPLAAVAGTDLAACAGFVARAAELGLAVLVEGTVGEVAADVAEKLHPGTNARVMRHAVGASAAADGFGALLAFQHLDATATVVTNAARRISGRDQVVSVKRRKVAIFTGSFDPPSAYHRRVAKMLRANGFDEVIIRPNGPKCDSYEVDHAGPIHRSVMADLAFRELPGVTVDLDDLDLGVFTPHVAFDDLFAERGEVWHIVSDEFVAGGRNGQSWVQTKWECGEDMWKSGRFVVLHRDEAAPDARDLPPRHQLVVADGHVPTADIRTRVFQGGNARPDVPEGVDSYIRRYGLFSGKPSPRETRVKLSNTRLKFVYDERNEKARRYAEKYKRYESSDPTHILVLGGDGTMLQAIREHWRLRLPFVGLNAGTLGFLMNESLPAELDDSELVLYRLPMLRVDTELANLDRVQGLACGDAWVERASGQAAWLRLDVDGRPQVSRVVGDGLLVSTPAGASSYARAMGATPVPLTAPVLTLAGSNVFLPRFWRPISLTESARVKLTSLIPKKDAPGEYEPGVNSKRPLRGYIDGHEVGAVKSMEIRASSVAAFELAFTPEFDLSARLLRSMFPAE
jgi:NAD kinase/nicotinic acid mononucleotide adenylyltransferase/NaMN:DMB phosphoribosyltransferase